VLLTKIVLVPGMVAVQAKLAMVKMFVLVVVLPMVSTCCVSTLVIAALDAVANGYKPCVLPTLCDASGVEDSASLTFESVALLLVKLMLTTVLLGPVFSGLTTSW
jgi:hypothetical protein